MKALKDEQVAWLFVQVLITFGIFGAKGWVVALLANVGFIILVIAAITVWGNYYE